MAQIVTQNLGSNNSIPKKGYLSHYKGIVLIIKRFREIHDESVCIFGKELLIYKFARLQTTA
ncbi:hypothetical protein KYTH15_07990 [Helicobacter pylori]